MMRPLLCCVGLLLLAEGVAAEAPDPILLRRSKEDEWQGRPRFWKLAMSGDGCWVAAADDVRRISLWDTTKRGLPSNLPEDLCRFDRDDASPLLAFFPTSNHLVLCGPAAIAIVDPMRAVTVQTVGAKARGVALSSTGALAYIAESSEKARDRVQIIDAASQAARASIRPGARIRTLTFSADGRYLAVARDLPKRDPQVNQSVTLWDAATGALLATSSEAPAEVQRLFFSADGRQLGAAGRQAPVVVWEIPGLQVHARAAEFRAPCDAAADLRLFVCYQGSPSQRLECWDLARQTTEEIPLKSVPPVHELAVSASGAVVATVHGDRVVRMWRRSTIAAGRQ